MSTSVVAADDYIFAGSPLVRFHRPSGKAKALGIEGVVQLAAADGTLFIAEQKATHHGPEDGIGWRIRSSPYATTRFSDVAKGDGTVYGLAASADGVAWSTIDRAVFPASDRATGSVWFRPKKGPPMQLAEDLRSPMGIALDGTHVYVALRGGRGDAPSNGSIVPRRAHVHLDRERRPRVREAAVITRNAPSANFNESGSVDPAPPPQSSRRGASRCRAGS